MSNKSPQKHLDLHIKFEEVFFNLFVFFYNQNYNFHNRKIVHKKEMNYMILSNKM